MDGMSDERLRTLIETLSTWPGIYADGNRGALAQARAAGELRRLAGESEANQVAIVEAGAIAPLIELLVRSDSEGARKQAAGALAFLCRVADADRVAIVEAGGIAPLLELVRSGDAVAKAYAAAALATVASNEATRVAIAEAGGIAPLVRVLRRGSEDAKWKAAIAKGSLCDVRNRLADVTKVVDLPHPLATHSGHGFEYFEDPETGRSYRVNKDNPEDVEWRDPNNHTEGPLDRVNHRETEARSMSSHWSPYDRVRVVNADP